MAEMKRCPQCGGLNPAAAEWCGQCLERFTPKPAPPPSPAPPVVEPPARVAAEADVLMDASPPEAGATGVAPSPASSPPPAAVGTKRGAFTVREHGVVWTCSRCDTENPLDQQICVVCGTTFSEVVGAKKERPERDPGTAAMISLFFPGAGHGYLGLWGQAIARGVVHAWVLFVVLISALQSGPGALRTAIAFGVAATALWGVSAHDAYREARHESSQVLLQGKVFLYVVLGLLMLLLVLVVTTGLGARS